MSEDREHELDGEREGVSRPVTAAARRERRASVRPATRKDRGGTAEPRVGGIAETRGSNGAKKGKPTPSRDSRHSRSLAQRLATPFKRLFRFLKEVVAELRKVIWPTRKQLVTYTVVVLVFVSFIVALVAGLDVAFAKGVLWLLG